MSLTVEQLNCAHASQGQAFLLSVQAAALLMPDGGRIVAITYAPGAHTGSWQSYIGQGTAKAALESLCRYFAVALAKRQITVNAISPGFIEDSILTRRSRNQTGRSAQSWTLLQSSVRGPWILAPTHIAKNILPETCRTQM